MPQEPLSPSELKVIRQNARASVLMGVDYVPAFLNGAYPKARDNRAGVAPAVAEPGDDEQGDASEGESSEAVQAGAAPEYDLSDPRRAAAHRELMSIRERYERDAPHKAFGWKFNSIVFGEGDPIARLMFVGEAPGADEDRTGRPFVGKAGQLLDRMIPAMGLGREDVYIANVLKTRPPGNATPTKAAAAACAPYLFDQIAAVRPEVIVTLGLSATRLLLSSDEPMIAMRGRWHTWSHPDAQRGVSVAVMPTFHPAFLLRQYTPENRNKVWADLRLVMERLGLGKR